MQQLWLEALHLLGHHHAWVCKAAARLAGLACAAPQPGALSLEAKSRASQGTQLWRAV